VDTSNAPQLASRLADTVQAAVRTGEHAMRLVLNPPDLGHLDVRVVERPDGVSVSLAAGSSDARDLLQQHLPALRAALEARDVRVDRLDVTQSSAAGLGEANDQPRGRREQQDGERPAWSLAAAIDGRSAGVGSRRAPATGSRLVDLVA
jgi:flagellar hook-length control protein FliK